MSKADEITRLLNGEGASNETDIPRSAENTPDEPAEPDGSASQADGEQAEEEGEGRAGLDEIAAKAGLDAKALYERMEVPIGDGESMTLGALKDLAISGRKAIAEADKLAQDYDDKHTELMVARRELSDLSEKLSPEDRATLKQINESRSQRELRALVQAIPSWKDKATLDKEQNLIFGLGAKYGIRRAELESLVDDHRMIKLLRDIAVSQARQQNSSQKAAPRPSGAIKHEAVKRATAPDATRSDKISAINALIS